MRRCGVHCSQAYSFCGSSGLLNRSSRLLNAFQKLLTDYQNLAEREKLYLYILLIRGLQNHETIIPLRGINQKASNNSYGHLWPDRWSLKLQPLLRFTWHNIWCFGEEAIRIPTVVLLSTGFVVVSWFSVLHGNSTCHAPSRYTLFCPHLLPNGKQKMKQLRNVHQNISELPEKTWVICSVFPVYAILPVGSLPVAHNNFKPSIPGPIWQWLVRCGGCGRLLLIFSFS